jgi:hypothetical protein
LSFGVVETPILINHQETLNNIHNQSPLFGKDETGLMRC